MLSQPMARAVLPLQQAPLWPEAPSLDRPPDEGHLSTHVGHMPNLPLHRVFPLLNQHSDLGDVIEQGGKIIQPALQKIKNNYPAY